MVEQDAVGCEQSVSLPIVGSLPVRIDLGAGVGAAGMERRSLALRNLGGLAEHLR